MGKLRPWRGNCDVATKRTQLGRNFTSPASGPGLSSSHSSLGEAVPRLGPSLVHPRGLALFQCTQTTGLQEVKTGRPQNRETDRQTDMLFVARWPIARIRVGSTGSSGPEASPSQQAQLQALPPLPSPELPGLHRALLLVWHLIQGTRERHLRLE